MEKGEGGLNPPFTGSVRFVCCRISAVSGCNRRLKVIKHISGTTPAWVATLALSLALTFTLAACNRAAEHPDVKDAVNTAMTRNNLGVVKVSQDREKGVITLTGDVETADQKAQAENVAAQAAPGYTISNEVGVRPVGFEGQAKSVDSSQDSGIEDNFKAALKAHKNLDDQSISYDAKNGTLVLKGSVKTQAQKSEAQKLAKAVPNVKEVVNEIEVKPDKDSTGK
jgi:hyperosmotically inducible periplasmic protein